MSKPALTSCRSLRSGSLPARVAELARAAPDLPSGRLARQIHAAEQTAQKIFARPSLALRKERRPGWPRRRLLCPRERFRPLPHQSASRARRQNHRQAFLRAADELARLQRLARHHRRRPGQRPQQLLHRQRRLQVAHRHRQLRARAIRRKSIPASTSSTTATTIVSSTTSN